MKKIAVVTVLFASFAVSTFAQDTHSHAASKPVVSEIKNAAGETVGTATLTSAPDGVRVKLDIKNLPPGQHSMHIHQVAKCEPPDFKSAGPHFNAAGHNHEAMAAGLPAGDIPNFFVIVGDDHTAHVTVTAPNVTMGADDHSVFSNGGTAIVIHAAEGGAPGSPARIACGVITKPE